MLIYHFSYTQKKMFNSTHTHTQALFSHTHTHSLGHIHTHTDTHTHANRKITRHHQTGKSQGSLCLCPCPFKSHTSKQRRHTLISPECWPKFSSTESNGDPGGSQQRFHKAQ